SRREDLNFLESLVRRHGISLILFGNPLNMDGSEGPQSAKARAFAAEVARKTGVEVELSDERLTSVEAESRLGGIREPRSLRLRSGQAGQADRAKRRGRVDQLAATILLQSYLDTRRAGGEIRAALRLAQGHERSRMATVPERSPSRSSVNLTSASKLRSKERNREGKP
ncbi:MAG: Holliday junction resolvase RuvX, partial [Terriglobia bacterium]